MSTVRQKEPVGFSVLDDLKTEELLDLIRTVSLESEPNAKFLSSLSSAYYARPDAIKIDINAAWDNFNQITSGGDFKSAIIAPENQTQTDVVVSPPQHKRRRILRVVFEAAIISALLFSLAITAGAFPRISQAIARWTEDVFYFEQNPGTDDIVPESPQQKAASYPDLQSALHFHGIVDELAPTWFPEGYSVKAIDYSGIAAWDKYTAVYENPEGKVIIIVIYNYYDEQDSTHNSLFEKTDAEVVEYSVNGIMHYLLTNATTLNAVWSYNDYECSIIIPDELPPDTLTKMIDSIYEG
jgi:hypothetical protein